MLFNKLEKAGVRGSPLKWLRTYLVCCSQKVRIAVSDPQIVTKGIPLQSVLLATLFLIFINGLLTLKYEGKFVLFRGYSNQ